MSFCMHCAAPIHETASACPKCGGIQTSVKPDVSASSVGKLWMSITSLVTGILAGASTLDDSGWDRDELLGVVLFFIVPAITFGLLTLTMKKDGKGMAIAGLVLAGISSMYGLSVLDQLLK
jgi:hypothetical protein